MAFLFIGATGDHAGHSIVIWAIARRLLETGLNVGFLKPFGTYPIRKEGVWTDRDALLLKEALNLQESFDRICPYPLSEGAWREQGTHEIIEGIKSVARELSTGKDIVIVMGSRHIFFDDASSGVSDIFLNTELKADFLLVDRYRKTSKSIYSILSVGSLLKGRIKGVIINRVPPEKLDEVKYQMIPSLIQKGIPITTALPEDPVLSLRSLREIREVLNGEILLGEEYLDQPVGGITVGSSDLKEELLLFKKVYNKLILLKPFSLDAESKESASPRSIAGIILTGGRNPAPQVLQAAKNAMIPIILVKDDTFAAMERLEKSTPALSPRDEAKVRRFTEMMDRDDALDRLLQSIGLIR